jgi:hypothetical protein
VISATGVRPELLRGQSRKRGCGPTGLCGAAPRLRAMICQSLQRRQGSRLIVIRLALRFRRRRCRSITVSASATLVRYTSARSNAFSKRESVGCEAKFSPRTQDRATVGTGVFLIEFSDDRLVRQIQKQNTLSCAIVIHAKAFFARRNACGKGFLSRSRPLCFLNS